MKIRMLCMDSQGPYFVEVEGEPVDLPNMPAGAFAVHRNPFAGNARDPQPLYCVTHVSTGGKMAGADSIDFAIRLAREKALLVTSAMYVDEIGKHRTIAESTTRVLDAQYFPHALKRSGPHIVCAACATPTDSIAHPLCAICRGHVH